MKILKAVWNHLEEWCCVTMMVIMLIAMFTQVILRFVFRNPNPWSEELSRYLHIYLIFLSSSLAMKHDAHIKVDALIKVWPKKIRTYVAILGEIVLLAFGGIVIYYGYKLTGNVLKMGQTSIALQIPIGAIYFGIPFGYTLMMIRLIANWTRKIRLHKIALPNGQ